MADFLNKPKRPYEQLRSHRWFGTDDTVPSRLRAMTHRTRMNQAGRDESEYVGKPIIGILSTFSDPATAHRFCTWPRRPGSEDRSRSFRPAI